MEIHKIPALRNPVMLIAFSGWNDAAEAATGAASHVLGAWTDAEHAINDQVGVVPELIADIDPEEFYDFQVNRPIVDVDESQIRSLTWPGTQIFGLATPNFDFDFIIVRGVEPSMKWKTFTHDLLDLADDLEVQRIITLGSMLADAPHSRPITVTGSGAHPEIAKRLGVEVSHYEGPTGILGVIADACLRRGIDAISLWAAIPHYASNSPSPKATLALINALEDFLEISLPQGDLHADSLEWESEVDELAREDSDVAEYVKALEESKDSALLSDVSGEDLARELERFLRRQNDN
ncbi:MAG: PAC2 family protein [Actinobacteria bacterium]|nr:PAC2 family protein [Actinomycetota bacterium]